MSTLTPFDMFGPRGITESSVKECTELFLDIVDQTLNYIAREGSKSALTEEIYSRRVASMLDVVEELAEMHNFMHEKYSSYMYAQNLKVQELIGSHGVMHSYYEHYEKLTERATDIYLHIQQCKIRINEAVEFVRLTRFLYSEYKNIMYSLIEGFSGRFKAYFYLILNFHSRKNLKTEMAHLGRKKNMYYLQMGKLKVIVEDRTCQDELKSMIQLVADKKKLLCDLRKKIHLKKNDVAELESFRCEIDELGILPLLETIKVEQISWRCSVDAHCRSLYHIAKSCYEYEVATEAVWFSNKIDLEKIQLLGLSDSIKKRIVWISDEVSCLFSSCLLMKKEADQTLKRIKEMKVEQLTLKLNDLKI